MTKELHIDLLCYLREQSKYDSRAKELFAELMKETCLCLNTNASNGQE